MFQNARPSLLFCKQISFHFSAAEKLADAAIIIIIIEIIIIIIIIIAKPSKQNKKKYDLRCNLLWFCFSRSGVVGGVHWGLGVGIGILASGVIINRIGIPKTYFMYAMTSIAMLTFMLLSYWLIKSREDKGEAKGASYQLVPQNKDNAE